ncbi:MAG: anthranilate synthase component I family protein, partial [Balneolales bacterium]|nr:anthranilate synthase component I family protein [Balneolales bacterium]
MHKEKAQILSALEYYKQFGDVVFLESQKADHPASENSYFAAKPGAWIKCYGNEVHIFENEKRVRFIDNPWNALQQFRDKHKNWLFGFLGYDLKNHLEALNS